MVQVDLRPGGWYTAVYTICSVHDMVVYLIMIPCCRYIVYILPISVTVPSNSCLEGSEGTVAGILQCWQCAQYRLPASITVGKNLMYTCAIYGLDLFPGAQASIAYV